MAKFYGNIGFGISKETSKDVWENQLVERAYLGDVNKTGSRRQSADKLNDDIIITNEISIVADPFANDNLASMLYVEFMGAKWKIAEIDVQHPRLILTTGGKYNG